ncbi:MAG: hypothetical protein ACYDA6_05155 [Solirubrobacteraceae bacterium]
MFSAIQKRLTYANVAATMALVFSMSGAAIAAKHYLINSTKQINPKVVRQLRGHNGKNGFNGKTGATGPAGSAGAAGAAGAKGATGPEGPLIATLPSGKTEYGTIGAEAQVAGVEVAANAQLPIPAPVALENSHVLVAPKTQCTGSAASPTAAAGYVCIYPYFESDAPTGYVWGGNNTKYGFQMSFHSTSVGDAVFANWAYTAP